MNGAVVRALVVLTLFSEVLWAQTPDPATIVGRYVFYNNSYFDGNDAGANANDDNAIAPDKVALLPSDSGPLIPDPGTSLDANYISYSKSINGIMIDITDLPETVVPDSGDFEFTNTGLDFKTTSVAASPTSISIRRGAGVSGSDRVTLIWADNAIPNTNWLKPESVM